MPSVASLITLSEVLSALSHALDLTEGQPAGHTIRSCIIGMRLAEECGLEDDARSALYFALLLKDAGGSSNAARFAALFGTPDQDVKREMRLVDWHQSAPMAMQIARTVGRGAAWTTKVARFAGIARRPSLSRELIEMRCERGADIARRIGFPPDTAEAILSLDEHWNGAGFPFGLRGADIPILSRIANLAQMAELFCTRGGVEEALAVARQRRGTWFDPRLVDRLLSWRSDTTWWESLRDQRAAELVVAAEPRDQVRRVDETGLDVVARAFADIIDAKSPYTFRHSSNVAEYARGIARVMGLDAGEQRRLFRAGLLHDIGKLGVSSGTLDKPGALDATERAEIERHPAHTWEILSRVSAFDDFAWLASVHHERLDRSGYPWKLPADELDLPARILTVADVYEALTANRPYRAGMRSEQAMAILRRDAETKLCPDAVDGLERLIA
ncbi:MAG: HD domain-containing phosphohydrolase [Gemmatimonadaceae bacterium]